MNIIIGNGENVLGGVAYKNKYILGGVAYKNRYIILIGHTP